MSRILVVDNEPAICWALREALTDDGHEVSVASSAEEALDLVRGNCRPEAVLLDVRLPGMDGLSTIGGLRDKIGTSPIIVMTAFGNLETAVRAVEGGAFDYLLKPFDLDRVLAVLRRALDADRANPEPCPIDPGPVSVDAMTGASAAMQQVFKQIALVAATDVNVLITGESGTGKELVARAIHRYSSRREAPYLPICIAALNPGLIESELFGHARGAFTGATEDRIGLLELAHGGTVLLDEIADVPEPVQVKLLRAIEQREVTPVGSACPRPTNLRILSATNRSLPDLISGGRFREDLYFRLGGFPIHLPPLRDRRDDIPLLAERFLADCRSRKHSKSVWFSKEAVAELCARAWVGNIRELKHAVEHAFVVVQAGEIGPEHLPQQSPINKHERDTTAEAVRHSIAAWIAATAGAAEADSPPLYEQFLQLAEPPLLEGILNHCDQNRAAAADRLGLHRATLRRKLRDHGIG